METSERARSVPLVMRAAVLGDAARLDIVEIAVPRPRVGEALVKVTACGVCHTDLHVLKDEVAFPRPAVLGHEISGTVVEFGPSTTPSQVRVGDQVVGAFIMPCTTCAACLRGRDDLCLNFFAQNRLNGTLYDGESRLSMPDGSFLATYSMGGLAEYAVVPVSALTALPEGIDPVHACVLGCAAFTAYGAVHSAGQVQPGDSVAVVGAGGIGSALIQVARAAGAGPVIAIDVASDKLEAALRQGATHVIDSRTEDPTAVCAEITGTGGVTVAFEAIGKSVTVRQAITLLEPGGRMVAVGIAPHGELAEFEITPLVRRGTTITGSFGARTRTDLPAVVGLAARDLFDLDALVTRRFPLDQADVAYAALDRGEITGRAAIVMNQED